MKKNDVIYIVIVESCSSHYTIDKVYTDLNKAKKYVKKYYPDLRLLSSTSSNIIYYDGVNFYVKIIQYKVI